MKDIVIGVGEFLWDMLPHGRRAGGAPVNFAYHASQSGAEGWAVSAVGKDDLGKELIDAATQHHINLLVAENDHPTGTVQVELKDGIPNYTICENVAWDYIPLTTEALEKARKAKAICFGSLAQRSKTSRETTEALVKAVSEGAYKVYDINLRQHFWSKELIESSLQMANVLKINDEELEIVRKIFSIEGLSQDEACSLLLQRYDLRLVVLTGGSRFSAIYTPDGAVSRIKTPKVKVEDTVGAGDAFTGALVASLIKGASVEEAHEAAVRTAAYVCTQSGAWTPAKL